MKARQINRFKSYLNVSRTKASIACGCLLLWLAAPVMRANAGTPIRDGFTLELGLGGAFTHVAFDSPGDLNEFGHSMLTLSLGAFINDDWAIMAHMAGTAAYKTFLDDDVCITNQFLGVIAQYWLTDSFFISGGAGVALWSVMFNDSYESDTDYGFALSARMGYSFLNLENHSFRIAVEMIPEFFDSRTVLGTSVNLEWQYF